MKGHEAIKYAIEGRFVKWHLNSRWLTINNKGNWANDGGVEIPPPLLTDLKKDSWEVKPEDIFVWGVSHKERDLFINYIGERSGGAGLSAPYEILKKTECPLFPTNKPQKFKLVPVDD